MEAPLATPTTVRQGFTVLEGSCPKGGPHVYGTGMTICHNCGGNRLHQPEHINDSSWRR